jgi:hypothetical protein
MYAGNLLVSGLDEFSHRAIDRFPLPAIMIKTGAFAEPACTASLVRNMIAMSAAAAAAYMCLFIVPSECRGSS